VKPLSQQNLYEVLDVPFDATTAVIAEAVERTQALYAPGSLATYTLMDPEEEQLLGRLLEEARSTLLDPTARARYDEQITGPDQPAPAAPEPAPEVDAAIRAVWPELPPVIPAANPPPEEDWAEELAAVAAPVEAPVATPPPQPVATPVPVIPALQPAAAPPAPQQPPARARPARILLSREVAPPPQAVPPPAPPPSAVAPVVAQAVAPAPAPAIPAAAHPVATPVPMVPPPPAPPVVPDGTTWSGEVLRRLREARGLSVQQVSERTKVTRHHIENIEADRYDQLPAAVYLRGILLSMARELRLDGPKVARSYLERAADGAPAGPPSRGR
jgi:hypothetical protein